MRKILIGSPVYIKYPLNLEFTQEMLASIKTSYEHGVYLVVNYLEDDMVELFRFLQYPSKPKAIWSDVNKKDNNVSSAWNMIVDKGIAEGYDYIIIPNNDIIFHPQAIDNLVLFADSHPEAIMWTGAEHDNRATLNTLRPGDSFDDAPHFSCFMISPKTIEFMKQKEEGTKEPIPGYFDEAYSPAYFEDGDYHNRILRAGSKALKTASAWFYHYGSRTIKSDDDLNNQNYFTYEKNRSYFINKWGFDVHGVAITNDSKVRFAYKEPFTKGDEDHAKL